MLISIGRVGAIGATQTKGVPASFWGDGPAPEGFHWEYVYDESGARATDANGDPVVELVEN